MKKKKLKLTKNDLVLMQKFNSNQKRIGEPVLTEDEYLLYLYGKNKHKKIKPSKYKGIDIPDWSSDWRSIPSCSSEGFSEGMIKNDDFKKEISKKFTVGLAYSKGNYQVLCPNEIQHAGRKI